MTTSEPARSRDWCQRNSACWPSAVCTAQKASWSQLLPGNTTTPNFMGAVAQYLLEDSSIEVSFQRWNAKVFADFACKKVSYFGMPWDRRSFVQRWVVPPRMTPAFPEQFATVRTKVAQEFVPFHTVICFS